MGPIAAVQAGRGGDIRRRYEAVSREAQQVLKKAPQTPEDGGLGEPQPPVPYTKPEPQILTQAVGLLLCCRDLRGATGPYSLAGLHPLRPFQPLISQLCDPGRQSRCPQQAFLPCPLLTARSSSRLYLPMWCLPHSSHQHRALIFLIKKGFLCVQSEI